MDYGLIKNILNSVNDCLIVLDQEGRVIYANEATQDILGHSQEDLQGKFLTASLPGTEENFHFHQLFIDAMVEGNLHDYREVDYHHPRGTIRRLAATTSYLLGSNEDGSTFTGFVAQFKDITEIFKLRREEKELIQEKERVSLEKIESLNKLAMGVAHEIRNPVVSIGGFASRIAREQNLDEEIREYADHIVQAAGRLEKLVHEVDECCSLPPPRLTDGDLSQVVSDVVQAMQPSAHERHISLLVQSSIPVGHGFQFDPVLIGKAVHALIDNAIHFSKEGGRVMVSVGRGDGSAIIEVEDSGTGIASQDLEFVFDPFFSTRPQAFGLGLTMVERVVQEHTGRIEVESAPGTGTTIRILLPSQSL
ncbi:MAG: ATP-binding protein [Deltaproteobacteria bacterium]